MMRTTMPAPPANSAIAEIAATKPFDFSHSLSFLGRFPAMTGEQRLASTSLTYALRENGVTVGARVEASAHGLRCELTSAGPLDGALTAAALDRVGFFLGVADDLPSFYALAAGDGPFRAVIARLHGYHQVKFPSPLELLVWAILGQRVPMPVARSMKHAIIDRFDNAIEIDGERHVAFPDLEQLCALSPSDWSALIRNDRKAGYLHGAVHGFAELDERFLRAGDEIEVREQLLALPGVGPWSATFLMIRGLGRMGTLPPDKEGKRAASRVYGHPVDDEEFSGLAERYGPWKGYWAHYMRVSGA